MAHTQIAIKQFEMFINGKFVANAARKMISVINPSTEQVISEIPAGTAEDAALAVSAAEQAQQKLVQTPSHPSGQDICGRLRSQFVRKKIFLAHTIVEEQGKILPLAEVEVSFTADYLDYMAEFARRFEGEIIPSDRPNETSFSSRCRLESSPGFCPGTSRSS